MRLLLVRFFIIFSIIFTYVFCLNNVYSYQVASKGNIKDSHSVSKPSDTNDSNTFVSEEKEGEVFASVRIPKININNVLYPINSKKNNVDKNIQIIKESDMPDVLNGNFILAAHSGLSSIAYFHNLDSLDAGDEVIVNYLNNDYKYIISDKYDVLKTGKVSIRRDKNRSTITMITCKGEDRQLVVIGYLV